MKNDERHGKSTPEWPARYRWLAILAVAVVGVVYVICKPPGPRPSTKDLFYEPLGGAWVNDSLGNGDGELNPGEQVKVFARLTNSGRLRISAFDLVLSTPENGVDVKDNRCHYPAIEPGQTVRSEDPFEFSLDSLFASECVLFLGRIENAAHAGFVGDAFAANGDTIPIILAAISNYRVCLASCNLQEGPLVGGTAREYTLTIDLNLCNASGGSLINTRMKIDSKKLIMCKFPSEKFNVMVDSLRYAAILQSGDCTTPDLPTSKFTFKVTMAPLDADVNSTCVYFTVLIYKDAIGTKPVARAFIGTSAKVVRSGPV